MVTRIHGVFFWGGGRCILKSHGSVSQTFPRVGDMNLEPRTQSGIRLLLPDPNLRSALRLTMAQNGSTQEVSLLTGN